MSDVKNRVSEHIESLASDSKEMVQDHALSAAMIAFGVGIGAGLAVVSLLADGSPARQASVTERLGRSLLDAMHNVVPDSLMKS